MSKSRRMKKRSRKTSNGQTLHMALTVARAAKVDTVVQATSADENGEEGMASLVRWAAKVDEQLKRQEAWRISQEIIVASKGAEIAELTETVHELRARINRLELERAAAGHSKTSTVPNGEVFELPPGVVDNRRTTSGQLVYAQLCRIEALLRQTRQVMTYGDIGRKIGENSFTVGRIISSDIGYGGTRFGRTGTGSVGLREFGVEDVVSKQEG